MKSWAILLLMAIAMLILALLASRNADAAARAWAYAFALVSMVPIGSLALLLVHGISGGRWGADLAPVLVPAARTMPLLFVAFLPVIVLRPLIYDWNGLRLPHDVLAFYLNPLLFDARTLIGLAVWSGLAWCRAWRNELFAALGLIAHLILMSLLPADWMLTIVPGSISAGFGLGFGIEQMFVALALVAVLAPQMPGRPNRDLAGLMLTTLLGTVYFLYMQYLIAWYGNVPAKVEWYARRAGDRWPIVMLMAFIVGAALPFLAILSPYVRREPDALRVVGWLVLLGAVLHVGWLMLPSFGSAVILPALFATSLLALTLLRSAALITPRGDEHGC